MPFDSAVAGLFLMPMLTSVRFASFVFCVLQKKSMKLGRGSGTVKLSKDDKGKGKASTSSRARKRPRTSRAQEQRDEDAQDYYDDDDFIADDDEVEREYADASDGSSGYEGSVTIRHSCSYFGHTRRTLTLHGLSTQQSRGSGAHCDTWASLGCSVLCWLVCVSLSCRPMFNEAEHERETLHDTQRLLEGSLSPYAAFESVLARLLHSHSYSTLSCHADCSRLACMLLSTIA
jgi:hypothetical protein